MKSWKYAGHLVLLGLGAFSTQVGAQVRAQEARPAAGLHVELEGRKPVTLSQGPLKVRLGIVKIRNREAPVAVGAIDGKQVFTLGAGADPAVALGSHIRIVTLDKSTPLPQVVLSRYTGGAHCCAETFIATQSGGQWTTLKVPGRDGEEAFSYEDADGDGNVDLIGADNRFYYAFDSYAGSLAPTQIYNLRGGKLVEVTREERFRPYLRAELGRQEKDANENPESWKANGFLAGWVAQKALLGEQADAWPRMLRNFDRESDWGTQCEFDEKKPKPAECSDPRAKETIYPRKLRAFLVKNGYLAANDAATR